MAEDKPKKNTGIFSLLSKLIAALLISWLFSIVLEWLGISFIWTDEGYRHSQQMMLQELGWLSEDLTQGLFHQSPKVLAETVMTTMHDWLFVKSGLEAWLMNPQAQGSVSLWVYHYGRAYIESAVYVSITFVIRLIVIICTSALFLLAAFAGFTEGLAMRDLRKFGAGRESSFIYHHARRLIGPIMLTAWVIYLSLPISIHPNFILVPSAFLFGLSICIAAASFKKYL